MCYAVYQLIQTYDVLSHHSARRKLKPASGRFVEQPANAMDLRAVGICVEHVVGLVGIGAPDHEGPALDGKSTPAARHDMSCKNDSNVAAHAAQSSVPATHSNSQVCPCLRQRWRQ